MGSLYKKELCGFLKVRNKKLREQKEELCDLDSV